MKLLTHAQAKLDKSLAFGYKSVGLNLSPANEADWSRTMCPWAGACADMCLSGAGQNSFDRARNARISRTRWWLDGPETFVQALVNELRSAHKSATRKGLKLAVRLNVLSDQFILVRRVYEHDPELFRVAHFYDYTKMPPRAWSAVHTPNHYHRTYSYSERTTPQDLELCRKYKIHIATVMAVSPGHPLPQTHTLHGVTYKVIDGDQHDLRFLDPTTETHIVGLRFKARSNKFDKRVRGVRRGFVQLRAV